MKITQTATGKAYQLAPGTVMEVERTNLFFNDYGEQTVPVTLPDTPHNLELTGHPEMLSNVRRPSDQIECVIQDGEYYSPARQAILSVKRKEGISTTFYMNEGSFLSRLQRVPLWDVFGDETVPGVTTVEEGIAWCWSLRTDEDENYTLFPVFAEMDGERRIINAMANMKDDGTIQADTVNLAGKHFVNGFYNAYERTQTVDERTISLAPGYYITPFIRARYVLRRLFAHFGYTLKESFFDTTAPYNKMAFVNNTMDALVNGTILIAHLVPDCYCSDIVDLFRKKFCCEFVPDESSRTVEVRFFNDLAAESPQADLTRYMDGYPNIEYAERRQLKLTADERLTDCKEFDSVKELLDKYPTAYCDPADGRYYRDYFTQYRYREVLNEGTLPYFADADNHDEYEVTVPETLPALVTTTIDTRDQVVDDTTGGWYYYSVKLTTLFIGEARALNSTLVINGTDEEEVEEDDSTNKTDEHSQNAILAFCEPTVVEDGAETEPTGTLTQSGCSLLYNAPGGIYEKFWAKYDRLLYNALNDVSADLVLPQALKNTLKVHSPVLLDGVKCLINDLHYAIGGGNRPMECTLKTLPEQEPKEEPAVTDAAMSPYVWKVHPWYSGQTEILTEAQWVAAGYKKETEVQIQPIYPPPPTEAQYNEGGDYYHSRAVYWSFKTYNNREQTDYTWNYRLSHLSLQPEMRT